MHAKLMTANLDPQWEKLKVIGSLIATLGIPLALALVANSFSKDQKELEIGVNYVELATQILREEPSKESRGLRTWAVSVIDHYSRVPLSDAAKYDLEFQRLKTEALNQSLRQEAISNTLNEIQAKIEAVRSVKNQ